MKPTKKPVWPHANYCRLTPHPSGSWCKRVDGELKYFGPLRDPDAALRKYLDFATARANEREAAEIPPASVTLGRAVNKFLEERHEAVKSGELTAGQYSRYRAIAAHILKKLGRNKAFASLRPADFTMLRKTLTGGSVTLKNKITWIRTILAWASDFYGVGVSYGGQFNKPSRRIMAQGQKPRKLFTPEELTAILKAASPTCRCFVYLGINCGYGQSDIANLPAAAVNLDVGFIDYPRGKTGIMRAAPLWPETVAALKAYQRPHFALSGLFFVTRFGQKWVRETVTNDAAGVVKSTTYMDAIGQEFDKACAAAGVAPRGFYTLRHTFRSVADEVADVTAIECIMGHLKPGMGGVYTQLMQNKMVRLLAVTNHVRQWLTQSHDSPPAV